MACVLAVAVLRQATLSWAGQKSVADRLASAHTLKCVFSMAATGGWERGGLRADVSSARLTIGFDSIVTDDGTARALGDFGPSEIIVRLSGTMLHLMQSFRDGQIYLTTVFSKETQSGRLLATHTRHEYAEVSLPGFTSRPQQYYGECDLQP